MMSDILIPLIVVGLAELGYKTQLTLLLVASKTEKHLHLFPGAMLALLMVGGTALLAGDWVASIAPDSSVKILSGTLFILFGLPTLIFRNQREDAKSKYHFKNHLYSGFILIFVPEWGDKTQIATGLLATKYNDLMVLIGVMMALGLLSIISIYSGKFISDKVNRDTLTKIAGLSFILMGIAFFLSQFYG